MKLINTEKRNYGGYVEIIYTIDKELKEIIDKILKNHTTHFLFARKKEDGNYEIKPATIRDHHLMIEIFKDLFKKQTNK